MKKEAGSRTKAHKMSLPNVTRQMEHGFGYISLCDNFSTRLRVKDGIYFEPAWVTWTSRGFLAKQKCRSREI